MMVHSARSIGWSVVGRRFMGVSKELSGWSLTRMVKKTARDQRALPGWFQLQDMNMVTSSTNSGARTSQGRMRVMVLPPLGGRVSNAVGEDGRPGRVDFECVDGREQVAKLAEGDKALDLVVLGV